MSGIDKIYQQFIDIEQELQMHKLRISGVHIWDYLRYPIFYYILHTIKGSKQLKSPVISWRKRVQFYIHAITNIFRNPLLSRKKDVLVVGNPRRLLRKDGYWWDIYTDPFLLHLKHSYVSVEHPFLLRHMVPARTKKLKYLDFIDVISKILQKMKSSRISISEDEHQILNSIQQRFFEVFGVKINFYSFAYKHLLRRHLELPLFQWMLRVIRPCIVLLVTHYGKETIIEACKTLHIPVAELQHGIITKYHPAYSYEKEGCKLRFPDYLLVFGKYWSKFVKFPIPLSHVITVGYPYLEMEHSSSISRRPQILFISQWLDGTAIAEFAFQLSKFKVPYQIVYKLHPLECENWEVKYPYLINSNIRVIDKQSAILYNLFAASIAQVGVFSTALLEGLAFGLRTFVIDMPGVENLSQLIELGVITKISSPLELANILNSPHKIEFDISNLFEVNAIKNILCFIDRFIKK